MDREAERAESQGPGRAAGAKHVTEHGPRGSSGRTRACALGCECLCIHPRPTPWQPGGLVHARALAVPWQVRQASLRARPESAAVLLVNRGQVVLAARRRGIRWGTGGGEWDALARTGSGE